MPRARHIARGLGNPKKSDKKCSLALSASLLRRAGPPECTALFFLPELFRVPVGQTKPFHLPTDRESGRATDSYFYLTSNEFAGKSVASDRNAPVYMDSTAKRFRPWLRSLTHQYRITL
jgi:hypothetical protein